MGSAKGTRVDDSRGWNFAFGPVLLSAVVTFPWLLHPSGEIFDHPIHERVALEWRHAWALGVAWPGLFERVNAGLGSFWPSYYPPLFHVATGALMCLRLSYWSASGAVIAIAHSVGTTLCFGWLRRNATPRAAMTGAFAYAIAPYPLFNLYHRGAFPEGVGIEWLPGVLWAIDILHQRWCTRSALLGLICMSLIVLTNLPASVVALCAIATYLVAMYVASRSFQGLARSVGILLAAACLTAFYWMSAWFDRALVYIPENDLARAQLSRQFYSYASFGLGMRGMLDWCVSVSFLWWQVGVIGLISGFFGRGKFRKSSSMGAFAVTGLGLWLCSDWSVIAYRYLPLLAHLQFPWRCLGMTTSGFALMLSLFIDETRPHRLVISAFFAVWGGFSLLILWRAEPIAIASVHPVSILADYIPVSSHPPVSTVLAIDPIEVIADASRVETQKWLAGEIFIRATSRKPFKVRIRTYWDQRWVGRDQDGRVLVTGRSPKDPLGRLEVSVPAGTTWIRLRLSSTRASRLGFTISLTMLFASAASLVWGRVTRQQAC